MATKKCPLCAEEIQVDAIKCRFCGEFLETPKQTAIDSKATPLDNSEFDAIMAKATQGDAKAQFQLGLMYAGGNGVPQDDGAAVKWYQKAAEQGDSEAQLQLGLIFSKARQGDAALYWIGKAVVKGNIEAIYTLGVFSAKSDSFKLADNCLREAAEKGHADAKYCLEHLYTGINEPKKDGETILTKLAKQGTRLAEVDWLIGKGADINAKNSSGKTPLMVATEYGKWDFAKHIIEKGADINQPDNKGLLALITVACRGQLEAVKMLIDAGADVNMTNNVGGSALMFAALYGHLDVVKLLVEKGANINARDNGSWTPLKAAQGDGLFPKQPIVASYIKQNGGIK